jgi:hypothetical protein
MNSEQQPSSRADLAHKVHPEKLADMGLALLDTVNAPLSDRFRDTLSQCKIWAPMLYTTVYIYCFHTNLETLDASFFASLSLIFVLAGITDYVREKNASLRHELTSQHRLLESQVAALATSLGNSRQDVVRA